MLFFSQSERLRFTDRRDSCHFYANACFPMRFVVIVQSGNGCGARDCHHQEVVLLSGRDEAVISRACSSWCLCLRTLLASMTQSQRSTQHTSGIFQHCLAWRATFHLFVLHFYARHTLAAVSGAGRGICLRLSLWPSVLFPVLPFLLLTRSLSLSCLSQCLFGSISRLI